MSDVIIHDGNWQQHFDFTCPITGKTKAKGLKPRNFSTHPSGCLAAAPPFPDSLLIPPSDQQAWLDKQNAAQDSLLDLRTANYSILKSLDQNGYGLCWAFDSTKMAMYLRIVANLPALILSAWYVAGKVKGWADEGGWAAESLQQIASSGVPDMSACPSYSSRYDTTAVATLAAANKCTLWYDGTDSRAKNEQIMISALLRSWPCGLDFNWWSHSVCGVKIVSLNPTVVKIDNSWGESAGDKGIYTLQDSKAIPDNIVVGAVMTAA